MLENNVILNYAKVGVIQSINTISEKIKKVEKRIKRNPESSNIELWKMSIVGYEEERAKLENLLIEIDNQVHENMNSPLENLISTLDNKGE